MLLLVRMRRLGCVACNYATLDHNVHVAQLADLHVFTVSRCCKLSVMHWTGGSSPAWDGGSQGDILQRDSTRISEPAKLRGPSAAQAHKDAPNRGQPEDEQDLASHCCWLRKQVTPMSS